MQRGLPAGSRALRVLVWTMPLQTKHPRALFCAFMSSPAGTEEVKLGIQLWKP